MPVLTKPSVRKEHTDKAGFRHGRLLWHNGEDGAAWRGRDGRAGGFDRRAAVNIENTDYHNEQEHYKQAYQSEMLVRVLTWFAMAHSSNQYIRQEYFAILNNNARLIGLKAYPNVWNGFNEKKRIYMILNWSN